MVGLFYTSSTVISIFVSQFLTAHSDKHGDRNILIFNCCLLSALGCVLFAYDRNYYLLLGLGVLLTSFYSTANPQFFALARRYADNTGREAVMFSSVLRTQVSLAWVIGPPAGVRAGNGIRLQNNVSDGRCDVSALRRPGLADVAFYAKNAAVGSRSTIGAAPQPAYAMAAWRLYINVDLQLAKCPLYQHSGQRRHDLFSVFDIQSGRPTPPQRCLPTASEWVGLSPASWRIQ